MGPVTRNLQKTKSDKKKGGSISQNPFFSFAFCIGLIPLPLAPLPVACLPLKMVNLEGSAMVFQLLFASLISAVSLNGSSFTEATSLLLIKVLTTFVSLCLHTCAGILSTSLVPSL